MQKTEYKTNIFFSFLKVYNACMITSLAWLLNNKSKSNFYSCISKSKIRKAHMVLFDPQYHTREGYRSPAFSVSSVSFLDVLCLNISCNLIQATHLSPQKKSVLKNPKLRNSVFNIYYNSISQIFHSN